MQGKLRLLLVSLGGVTMDGAMDGAAFDLLKLPAELQAMVFAKVESKGLVQLSATCKTLHTTINDARQDERCSSHLFVHSKQHTISPVSC